MIWCKPAWDEEQLMRWLWREWLWHQQRQALRDLQLLVLDVDGVLTDGGL